MGGWETVSKMSVFAILIYGLSAAVIKSLISLVKLGKLIMWKCKEPTITHVLLKNGWKGSAGVNSRNRRRWAGGKPGSDPCADGHGLGELSRSRAREEDGLFLYDAGKGSGQMWARETLDP